MARGQQGLLPQQHALAVCIRPAGELARAAKAHKPSCSRGRSQQCGNVAGMGCADNTRCISQCGAQRAGWAAQVRNAGVGRPVARAGLRITGTTGVPRRASAWHTARPDRPDAPITCTGCGGVWGERMVCACGLLGLCGVSAPERTARFFVPVRAWRSAHPARRQPA